MIDAIVLGNDHTNTLGVVQALGSKGLITDAYVWGVKRGLVKASKFANNVYGYETPEQCIEKICCINPDILNKPLPIIACSDTAALLLERMRTVIPSYFVYAAMVGKWSIEAFQDKNIQVKVASEAGLCVPESIVVDKSRDYSQLSFAGPYLVKPLVSLKGAKSDIQKCSCQADLRNTIEKLFQKYDGSDVKMLIQQYIRHDYEISLLGVATQNGKCIIPAIENKLTQFPLNVGLECRAEIERFEDSDLKRAICKFVQMSGYRGLFSIEMMHSPQHDRFFFTEMNLRNDGANSFILQAGANLPFMYYADMKNIEIESDISIKKGKYIWEMHHLQSAKANAISWHEWAKDICRADGFLLFTKHDRKPFLRQLFLSVSSALRIKKIETY